MSCFEEGIISDSDGNMNSSKKESQFITEEGRLGVGREDIISISFSWRKVCKRIGSCSGVAYGSGGFWFRPSSWVDRR